MRGDFTGPNDALPPAPPSGLPTGEGADAGPISRGQPPPAPPALAPALMMVFWMLLGGAAGIRVAQAGWQLLGWGAGDVAVAVPVGGVAGGVAGALLGLVSNPRALVLLMAVFAGSAAGAVAGKVPWGDAGELGGQAAGALLGGVAWAVWLLVERRRGRNL